MNAVRSIYAPPNKSFDTDARLRASHALLFLSCWMPFARAGQFQRSVAPPSHASDVESKMRAAATPTLPGHGASAAEQLIAPNRIQLASHPQLAARCGCLPAGEFGR